MATQRTEEILNALNETEEILRRKNIELVRIKCELETVSINVKGNELDHSKFKDIKKVLKKIENNNKGIQTCVQGMDKETYKILKNLDKQRDSGIEANPARASCPDINIGEPVQEEGVDNDAETIDVQSAVSQTVPRVAVESEEEVNDVDPHDPHRLLVGRRDVISADSGYLSTVSSFSDRQSVQQRDSNLPNEVIDHSDQDCEKQDGADAQGAQQNDLNRNTRTGSDSGDDNTEVQPSGEPRASVAFLEDYTPDDQEFLANQTRPLLSSQRVQRGHRRTQSDIAIRPDSLFTDGN